MNKFGLFPSKKKKKSCRLNLTNLFVIHPIFIIIIKTRVCVKIKIYKNKDICKNISLTWIYS